MASWDDLVREAKGEQTASKPVSDFDRLVNEAKETPPPRTSTEIQQPAVTQQQGEPFQLRMAKQQATGQFPAKSDGAKTGQTGLDPIGDILSRLTANVKAAAQQEQAREHASPTAYQASGETPQSGEPFQLRMAKRDAAKSALTEAQKKAAQTTANVKGLESLNPWLARGENPVNDYEKQVFAKYKQATAANDMAVAEMKRVQRDYENLTGEKVQTEPEDTRSEVQKKIDRILGVDSSKVTGEKTNLGKLVLGNYVKGMYQWANNFWKTANMVLDEPAQGIHDFGTTAINSVIETLNDIPGVNIKELEYGDNFVRQLYNISNAEVAAQRDYFAANANTSRAAQLIDRFGTETVAAVPFALEALFVAGAKAPQLIGNTTKDLRYLSSINGGKGIEVVGAELREGIEGLARNPQFWSSYLQTAGGSYEEALQDGMDEGQAAIYALTNGAMNAAIEVGGIDEALGGIQNMTNRKNGGNILREALLTGGQELGEEIEQGITGRGLKAMSGQDVPLVSFDKEDNRAIFNPWTAAEEGLGGFVVGSLLGGGQTAISNIGTRAASTATQAAGENAVQEAAPEQAAMEPTAAEETGIAPVEQTVSERSAPEVQNSTAEATDTTGRDYEQAGKQYGIIPPGEKATRESNVPNRMDNATAVGRTARTLYEAGATPEMRLQDIRNAVVDGKFDYVPVSNNELTSRATKKIEQQGWQPSLAEFMADVRSGRRNESVVALGAVLLNNAANSSMSGEQYAELVAAYHQAVHDPARALAAARIMKTLTPEARLYAITKQVQTMSDELADRSARRQRNKPNAKQVADEANATKKRTIEKVAEEWSEFKFADEAAKRVADSIKNQIKNSFTPKTKNALDTFVGYVKKFASEKIDLRRNANKPMTATDLLTEIAQNEDLFREVYEKAQAQFADENSTGYREFVSDYLNEPVNLSGAEGQRGRLFARAIAESAVATGENVNYIRNQSALGITNGVIAERIASNLIRQTGAQGELADSIRQAANRYVESAVNGDASNNRTERLVSGMMKNLAARFSKIASQDSATKESIAQDLADQLAIEYGLDPQSAKAVAESATNEYNRQLSEAMEKEVARRFAPKEATERQRKEFAQQLAEAINLGAFDSEYAQQATDKLFGIDGGIKLDPALIEKYLAQDTEQGRDDVIDEMMQNVADQMPSTLMDKWAALRYVNMLGNFKTQSRNLIGNVLMGVNTAVKSRVGAAIEAAAQATGAYKGERTKSVWAGHKLYGEAWNDYSNVKAAAEGEGKYQDNNRNLSRAIQDKRTIFKNNGTWGTNEAKTAVGRSAPVKAARKVSDVVNKGLEGYRKATNWAMTEGDNIFLRFTYMDALGGYLAANKVKSISDASPELLDRARAYAIKQAQEATFHDSNGLSEWASSFDRGWDKTTAGKVAKTVTQGVLPFRKTPANVLVRAEEYSPVGVLNTLVKAVQAAEGKPDVSGADVIESLSKTLTGSSLTVLGYLLGMAGKARAKGSDDDKLKKLEAEEGKQDYSVTLGDGSSLSLEWAAPSSIPFFMGARLAEITDGESPYTILTLLGGVTDPVLQMSMLSGLNDALNNLDKYNGDIEAVPSFMLNSLFSYLTQGMTNSLVGQAEQASEGYRRSTYTDKESPLSSSLQYALSRAGAKIPGVDYHQQDYYDAYGRKVENGTTGERIMSAFFSPAYKKEDRTTEVDDELARLYKETGENVLGTEHKPKRGDKINGEVLSPEEFEQYSVTRGELAYDMIDGFIKSDEYKNLSDADRAEIILNLYQFAADQAKKEIARDRGEEYANTDWNKVEALAQEDEDEAVNYLSVRTVAKNAIQGKDYDVLDQLLGDGGAYHKLGEEAQDMLSSIDGLKRLVSMRGDGVSAENAMKAIDAIKGMETQDAQTAAIVGLDGMSDTDKIKALKACTAGGEGYAEKVQAAYDSGVSLDEWSRVYAARQRIDKGEGTAQNKATDFAAWLDKNTNLTASQKDIVQEQLSFFSMNKAEPTHYDGLRESKVNEDTARRIANAMTRIQPLEGKTQATQEQKVDTILGMGLSDGDTWAALKEYTSESYYNKAAEAYRRGIDLDDYVSNFKAVDTNDSGDLTQAELYAFYMQNPKQNETYCKVMLMILSSKTDWDTFLKKQAKAAKK